MGSRPSKNQQIFPENSKWSDASGEKTLEKKKSVMETKEPDASSVQEVTDPGGKDVCESLIKKDLEGQDDIPTSAPQAAPVETLTEDKIAERHHKTVSKVEEAITQITEHQKCVEDDGYSNEFREGILTISRSYFGLKGAPLAAMMKMRMEIGKILHESKVVTILCDVIIHSFRTDNYKTAEGKIKIGQYNPLKTSLLILLNYTDAVTIVSEDVCNHSGMLETVAEKLKALTPFHLDGDISQEEDKLIKLSLGLIHNVAMVDTCVSKLHWLNFTQVLLPYTSARAHLYRLSAIAALADIVDEKDCELLQTNCAGIRFLLKILGKALESKTHKELGWSAKELGRAVGKLARCDANKKLLVEEGALPSLVKLAKSNEVEEEREAVESLWVLSFDEENKINMIDEPELIDLVMEKYRHSGDKDVKRSCQGILWTLREKLSQSVKYADIEYDTFGKARGSFGDVKADTGESKASAREKDKFEKGHVMLSYQWANQEVIKQVREELCRRKFDVWMDIDNMGGSTLQAMAEAIEDAQVVLVCMSHKYKDSPNCRAEAEYAFQKRKKIIPLVMELGYRPDGWLGMILGAKLFYDFSGKYTFQSRVEGLVKELNNSCARHTADIDVVDSGAASELAIVAESRQEVYRPTQNAPAATVEKERVEKWSKNEVKSWLKNHNLSSEKLNRLTGREIAFLKRLRNEAPEYFYNTVEKKLGIEDLLGLVNFTEALDELSI